MYKGCENCSNCIYEKGQEDYDQYCLKGIDINTIPDQEDDLNYKCPKWRKEKDD
mgnify:CR=1 FL=1